ncbi:MAG: peptidase [Lachnospiraceae bacterium]|nr:peptidase [Lachnospiraceae bacterium]
MNLYRKPFQIFFLFSVLLFSFLIPIKVTATEVSSFPTCYVRFSGKGLSVYADSSMKGKPIATLPDGTAVQVISGPMDSCAGISIYGTTLDGYVDVRYLKQADAIVCDYDMYTYDEMVEDIQQLQARYPGLLRVNTIGTSVDNRVLYELVMGNENAAEHILIQAGIHAREYANPLLVMEQLEYCLKYYDCGTYGGISYRELFSNAAIHIIPMVNPDGIAISQFGESGLRSSDLVQTVRTCYQYDILTKRTKSSYENYLKEWKANAHGVDLNRNFPAGFGSDAKAVLPSYSEYTGAAPLSEPETSALAATTQKYSPSIIISYHSMGEIAYYDVAGTGYRQLHKNFSKYMLSLVPYKKMPVGDIMTGSYLDYVYSNGTPVCSITFETGNVACPLPATQYPKIWLQHNIVLPAAALYAYIN